MDFLASLISALARLEQRARMGGGRRPGNKKRPKIATGRPAKTGPSAGCGTGAGGFKVGNNCAKEDGIPQRPLSHGGALKGANAKDDIARAKAMRERAAAKKAAKEAADKAKSEATRPQREKQKKINKLRAEAAKRKAEKGERDAAEKQAADEAAAKKRAALLQKIRIKKANDKLDIVEAPAARFSGTIDTRVEKLAGETQIDFAKRRIEADMKRLHSEMDAIENREAASIKVANSKIQRLEEEERNILEERQALAAKLSKPGAKKSKADIEEYQKVKSRAEESLQKLRDARKELREISQKAREEEHDLIGEFVAAHGGGTISVKASEKFADADHLAKTRSQYKEEFMKNAEKAWAFLNKTTARMHQEKADAIRVRLDTDEGDADYNDVLQIARHGTRGSGEYNTADHVIVHEIAHGLHYGPHPKKQSIYGPDGKLKLPSPQDAIEWLQSPAYRARLAIKEDYDARVAALKAAHGGSVEQIAYHPKRTSYKLWVPKGEKRRPLGESYLGYANQYSDAEHGTAINATEVVSVGVEEVYKRASRLRRVAPSHFDIMMLFMAGRIH